MYHITFALRRFLILAIVFETQPNVALISEEVKQEGMKLSDITELISDCVCARAEKNMNYGIVLVPEGLLQFIPTIQSLIEALSHKLAPDLGNGAKLDEILDITKKIEFARSLVSQTRNTGDIQNSGSVRKRYL